MTEELIELHEELLEEFKRRVEENEEIPEGIQREMDDLENMGLEDPQDLKEAIGEGLSDESS